MNKAEIFNGRCFACKICNGKACRGIIPGMGGLGNGNTFVSNYDSWENIKIESNKDKMPKIVFAPMTGVDENMGGYLSEREFHHLAVKASKKACILHSIGDGFPEYKLEYGAEALRKNNSMGAVFLKPFRHELLMKKYNSIKDVASFVGIDIDCLCLPTLKGVKDIVDMGYEELNSFIKNIDIPFIIKGIFDSSQIELIRKLRPFGVVVSNHGGRVFDNGKGIAYILKELENEIRPFVKEIWVDGGLRKREHLLKAKALGADRVIIGRPFAVNTILYREKGVVRFLEENSICL